MLIIKYTNSIDMWVGVPYGTFTKKSSFAEEILYSVNVILQIKAHLLLAGRILLTILHHVINIHSTSTYYLHDSD